MFFHQFFDSDDSDYSSRYGSYYQRSEDVNNSRLYEILGVPKNATNAQIRKAYLVKAKQMHPDKGGNPIEVLSLSTLDLSSKTYLLPMTSFRMKKKGQCMISMASRL